jgi:hypothetical protein
MPSPIGRDFATVGANLLALPVNVFPWSLGLSEVRVGGTARGALGGIVNLDRTVGRRERAFGAISIKWRELGNPEVGRQVLLWLPGEATTALGRRWRETFRPHFYGTPMIAGLANGSMAYVTTPEEYDNPRSYEAASCLYGRDAARLVEESLDAAFAALREGR